MSTGENLKELRKLFGITQTELANWLGVSQSMIVQYEKNIRNPKQETIRKILQVYTDKVFPELKEKIKLIEQNTCNTEIEQLQENKKALAQYRKKLEKAKTIVMLLRNNSITSFDRIINDITLSDLEALDHFRPLNAANKEKAIDYMDYLYDRQDPEDPAEPGAEE